MVVAEFRRQLSKRLRGKGVQLVWIQLELGVAMELKGGKNTSVVKVRGTRFAAVGENQ